MAFEEYVKVWHATMYPNSLHLFQREIQGRQGGGGGYTYLSNFNETDTGGIMSKAAQKRIERAVVWLLFYSKQKRIFDVELQRHFNFRINFITLTLPAKQWHTDEEIKKTCLNNFLTIMRKYHGLGEYIWKAEAQINGNIHFHLVTDTYIRYDKIQQVWNDSVQLLQYIDKFEYRVGHRHPNSTDVHSVKHVKKVASYIGKYMSKNRSFAAIGEIRRKGGKVWEILYGTDEYRREEANKKEGAVIGHIISGPIRKIEGRLWFLSRGLSKCKPVRINEEEHDLSDLQTIIQKGNLRQFNTDFSINYYGEVARTTQIYSKWLYHLLRESMAKSLAPMSENIDSSK